MSYLVKSPINKNVNFIHVYATSESPTYTYTAVAAPEPFTRNQQFGGIIKPSTSSVSLSAGNVILDTKNYLAWVPGSMIASYSTLPTNISNLKFTYVLYLNNVEIYNQTFASNFEAVGNSTSFAGNNASLALNTTWNELGMASFSAISGDVLSMKIYISSTNISGATTGSVTIIFPGTDSQTYNPSAPLTSIFLWEIEK